MRRRFIAAEKKLSLKFGNENERSKEAKVNVGYRSLNTYWPKLWASFLEEFTNSTRSDD